jgi:hypothetical protein
MRTTVIFMWAFFLMTLVYGQKENCNTCGSEPKSGLQVKASPVVSIFPNPASDYLSLRDEEGNVNKITIFNLVGQNIKEIQVIPSESIQRFNVTDLSQGLYLVQLWGKDRKILNTLRLQIR